MDARTRTAHQTVTHAQATQATTWYRGPAEPEQRSHKGWERMYVLAGRLRLPLGPHDLVLSVGEMAEFDTCIPHWFT